jgi:hypothetical protein
MRRTWRRSWVGALVVLLTLALPVSASAGAQPPGSVRLFDGRTFAHWAHPERMAAVRRLPSQTSRRVARIHYLTEDGLPEVYPILRRFSDRRGRTWLRIRIPMRPNGRTPGPQAAARWGSFAPSFGSTPGLPHARLGTRRPFE